MAPTDRPAAQDEHEKLVRAIEGFISTTSPELLPTAMFEHYLEFLHPSMPVLPLDPAPPFGSLPPGLRAAILVEAFAYFATDPRQSAYAWSTFKSSQVSDRLLYASKLSSLATAILELSSATDPRGDYLLLAKVSTPLAFSLYPMKLMSRSEVRLSRKRKLWGSTSTVERGRFRKARRAYARVYGGAFGYTTPGYADVEDQATSAFPDTHSLQASFLNSHPSHIQQNNQNVELPALPSDVSPVGPAIANVAFVLQCRLAIIVSRLQHDVCTLESFGSPDRVASCDAVERDLDALCGSVSAFTASRVRPVGMGKSAFALTEVG